MKVIDLLNKIANGEEVPEKIKILYNEFYYDKDNLKYRNVEENRENLFEHIDFFKGLVLNDEVEIIEDTPKDKKIEKLDIVIQDERTGNAYILNEYGTKCYLTKHSKIIANKLNEIIDKINEGEENE